MSIDAYVGDHQGQWDRLGRLVARAGRRPNKLSAEELEELVGLYQQVSAQLSHVRTAYRDPALTATLTRLVARAASVVYGTRSRNLAAVGRFFSVAFPASVWHARVFILASAALFLVPSVGVGVWVANSDAALQATGPAAVREAYVADRFEDYYSSQPAAAFSSQVFTNNVRVGFLAFAGGIAYCLVTAVILAMNGASLGVAAGMFSAVGESGRFWGLILPHGLLEITAVFIAGGAGLRLGWTLIDPGDRPRLAALAQEGRRSVTIVIGLVAVFGVAGIIEGFVTGSGLPTWVRVGIGTVVEVAFLLYAIGAGRRAQAAGFTGSPGEELRRPIGRSQAIGQWTRLRADPSS